MKKKKKTRILAGHQLNADLYFSPAEKSKCLQDHLLINKVRLTVSLLSL